MSTNDATDLTWEERYFLDLAAYVANRSDALERAYVHGRAALDAGMGLLDVVVAHRRVASRLPATAAGSDRDVAAQEFLAECLAPYEMAFRGYRQACSALQAAKSTLEQRVQERTSALERAEQEHRSLVEQLPAATYRCDAHDPWRVRYVSPQLETLFGIAPTAWLGVPLRDRVLEADRARVLAEIRRAQATRKPIRCEYRLAGTKATVWVRDEARWYSGEAGDHVQGILLDVTESKRLEEQVLQAQRAESVGRLAGGIAHDFNNLLSIILSYSELLLERTDLPDEVRTEVQQVEQAGERAAALTGKLLAFSRKQILDPRLVDLNDTVSQLQPMLRRLIPADVRLDLHLAQDLHGVYVDPVQIEQVLLNLAVNARDAMPEGGTLAITTGNRQVTGAAAAALGVEEGVYAGVSVADTGTGMSPEVRARLFEPYFTTKERRAAETASKGVQLGGTGLGLATSYGVIKQSGGAIDVATEVGHGSTFHVLLPRAAPQTAAAAPIPKRSGKTVGGETILVVEDEADVRAVIVRTLSQAGYRVLQAGDGVEAFTLATSFNGPIDLLFTDVIMPGLNGREVAELISAGRSGMRVLYTSGYHEVAAARGLVGGDLPLVPKPLTPTRILERVRAVLDLAATGGQASRGQGAPTAKSPH
jgi:two-component system cell cycle sensor histidine kinase/response regulator CckA